jgi:hypothetical protein
MTLLPVDRAVKSFARVVPKGQAGFKETAQAAAEKQIIQRPKIRHMAT